MLFQSLARTVRVGADDRICLSGEDGEHHRRRRRTRVPAIAVNSMGDLVMATPALSDGGRYVRSSSSRFALGKRSER